MNNLLFKIYAVFAVIFSTVMVVFCMLFWGRTVYFLKQMKNLATLNFEGLRQAREDLDHDDKVVAAYYNELLESYGF